MTNVVGYVRVIDTFLPLLDRSADPRIVNVGSGLASFGSRTSIEVTMRCEPRCITG
ncbi:hypothetical protein [Nonomuraea sp. NPDC049784]|uniref:hypothetical protein n=1 Tax=Nonomuraea sp. NPDC049784 TaxID=3154361 RepID=UPI0034010579